MFRSDDGRLSIQFDGEVFMRRSKQEIESKIDSITRDLLCWAGLKDAKKIISQVKGNLITEQKRRGNMNHS